MGEIIRLIKNSRVVNPPQPALAKVPFVTGTTDEGITQTKMNTTISGYNKVVVELVGERSLGVSPPDFYLWFKGHPGEIHAWFMWDTSIRDNLHPTNNGYWSMARHWRDELIK